MNSATIKSLVAAAIVVLLLGAFISDSVNIVHGWIDPHWKCVHADNAWYKDLQNGATEVRPACTAKYPDLNNP
jgi:hypothetical protein